MKFLDVIFNQRVFRRSPLAILPLLIFLLVMSSAAYDLGGPCLASQQSVQESTLMRDLNAAEQARQWENVVALRQQFVRNMCQNDYRWYTLASALIKAGKPAEAVDVLDEMDRRGFELKSSQHSRMQPEVDALIDDPLFKKSAVGQRLAAKEAVSQQRRREFQDRLAKMTSAQKPPSIYVAKGVCPFECCTYRDWTVEVETPLVDRPNGSRVVGKAVKGAKVTGLTGEVHVKPVPIGVVYEHGSLAKGDIIFLLDQQGEGYAHFWHQGKVGSDEVAADRYCLSPGPNCWGEYIDAATTPDNAVWWVRIRLSDGTIGWTDKADHFGNKDSCG